MKSHTAIKAACLVFALLPLLSGGSYAQKQKETFTREYTYTAGEADSKLTSRKIATDEIRNILLREIGTLVREEIIIVSGNTQEYIQKLETLTAGIVKMETLDERWDGKTYYIKARMTVDLKDFRKRMDEERNNRQKEKELEDKIDNLEEKLKKAEINLKEAKTQGVQVQQDAREEVAELKRQIAKLQGQIGTTYTPPPPTSRGGGRGNSWLSADPDPYLFIDYRYSQSAPYGLSVGYCKRFGGYASVRWAEHLVSGNDLTKVADFAVDFTDKRNTRFAATGGAMLRVMSWLYLYAGGGYGTYGAAYKVNGTATGFGARSKYYCPDQRKGFELDGGAILSLRMLNLWRLNFSVGYNTIIDGKSPRFDNVQLGAGLTIPIDNKND